MKKLWVRHIKDALHTGFEEHIDLSDYEKAPASVREKAFLSRALAALAVQRFTELSAGEAAAAVVDGSGDNGIDAIAIDAQQRKVIVVQSKWDGSGDGSLGLGDSRNFAAGFKDLLDTKFDRFNSRLRAHEEKITAALDDIDVKFVLVVATTGITELAGPSSAVFDDLLAEMNETQEVVSMEVLGLTDFHSFISEGLGGSRIDFNAQLGNWGTISEPYEAYYGVVSAADIAGWYERFGDRLFSQNIRKALGNTGVNESVAQTLLKDPQHFWYFNNGVTALCESVKKTPRGAATRTFGDFALTGVSIVNGAQTVASINQAAHRGDNGLDQALVWVRFINLEGCPEGFATDVTRATNTQNTVETRDFVALDPEQDRLRTELALSLKKTYSIKRGEKTPSPEHGCTVVDATVALACANREPSLAVLAKSRVGGLWESTEKPPYRTLFNPGVGPYRVWRCVEVMREVDATLEEAKRELEGRARSICLQGNRIVLHLVFRELDLQRIDDAEHDWSLELKRVPSLANRALQALTSSVEEAHPGSYLTSLFKNRTKCRDLVQRVRAE
ncbi:AIPR family protein [Streptomyces sp. WMMB 322]|uniref:AIPR family protein n=1 Tax=Streptomyces sp. WMMB 322 TaxID=1286821 RepID=UPI0006E35EDB|nr:AIPR family protein [Streptomyces sp. WMMB 322]SCK15446.1 AIPR protein [Streptomyces sp. WMMB 322]